MKDDLKDLTQVKISQIFFAVIFLSALASTKILEGYSGSSADHRHNQLSLLYNPFSPKKVGVLAQYSGEKSKIDKALTRFVNIDQRAKKRISNSIRKASKQTGIPEELILALIKKESSFRIDAISKQGARGLTQLMPRTAKVYCGLSGGRLMEIENNILCGSTYFKKLLVKFNGDVRLSLVAYNTGPALIQKLINSRKKKQIDFEDLKVLLDADVIRYVESIIMDYYKLTQS